MPKKFKKHRFVALVSIIIVIGTPVIGLSSPARWCSKSEITINAMCALDPDNCSGQDCNVNVYDQKLCVPGIGSCTDSTNTVTMKVYHGNCTLSGIGCPCSHDDNPDEYVQLSVSWC